MAEATATKGFPVDTLFSSSIGLVIPNQQESERTKRIWVEGQPRCILSRN